jgi:hypothetical protein
MHTRTLSAALACLVLPVLAAAQDAQLKLPSFADKTFGAQGAGM